MGSEKQIKSFILSRFYMVFAVVSVVELFVVFLTNTFLIPWLIRNTPVELLMQIDKV